MKTNKLRTIIVDDSSLQRIAVSKLINDHPNLDLIAEYNNGMEAYKNVEQNKIDLIFLDVEMPILDGFEFIESLSNIPQIILVTSKADYALKAFEYDVTDYLLKPISKTRFDAAIKKAVFKNELATVNKADEAHIYVNSNLKKVKVVINDIKWIDEKIDKFSSAQVEVAGQPIPLSRYKKIQLEEALLSTQP